MQSWAWWASLQQAMALEQVPGWAKAQTVKMQLVKMQLVKMQLVKMQLVKVQPAKVQLVKAPDLSSWQVVQPLLLPIPKLENRRGQLDLILHTTLHKARACIDRPIRWIRLPADQSYMASHFAKGLHPMNPVWTAQQHGQCPTPVTRKSWLGHTFDTSLRTAKVCIDRSFRCCL
jgi:hypothetical protein